MTMKASMVTLAMVLTLSSPLAMAKRAVIPTIEPRSVRR